MDLVKPKMAKVRQSAISVCGIFSNEKIEIDLLFGMENQRLSVFALWHWKRFITITLR